MVSPKEDPMLTRVTWFKSAQLFSSEGAEAFFEGRPIVSQGSKLQSLIKRAWYKGAPGTT